MLDTHCTKEIICNIVLAFSPLRRRAFQHELELLMKDYGVTEQDLKTQKEAPKVRERAEKEARKEAKRAEKQAQGGSAQPQKQGSHWKERKVHLLCHHDHEEQVMTREAAAELLKMSMQGLNHSLTKFNGQFEVNVFPGTRNKKDYGGDTYTVTALKS